MNINAVLILVLLLVSVMSTNKNTRLYFTAFSLMMLGHYCMSLALDVKHANYSYFSSAVLVSYLTYLIPKTRENIVILTVCGASILAGVMGGVLWSVYLPTIINYQMFIGVYMASICYVTAKGVKDGDYSRGLYSLRNLFVYSYSSLNRRFGGTK